jgi:carbamoyl-phosphate synthase small subunit
VARKYTRKLVLENGLELYGYAFGGAVGDENESAGGGAPETPTADIGCSTPEMVDKEEVGSGIGQTSKTIRVGKKNISEIVFNTSMVGYQEIISDPSYTGQTIVMTYPLMGNYGVTDDDYEARHIGLSGLIVRELNEEPSNFRFTKTLSELLEEQDIPGISGIDTRMLTRIIRNEGSQKAMLADPKTPLKTALEKIQAYQLPTNQIPKTTCKKKWYSRTPNPRFSVVLIDCGTKLNIVRELNARGCNVTVVPYNTPAEAILRLHPEGVCISNGPGNPEDVPEVIETVSLLRGKIPIMGICLGHQIICIAHGAETYKLKFGHRGGNHPIKNLLTGKIEITSQNHSYSVKPETLERTGLEVTHVNLLDDAIEGVRNEKENIFSVQYHPESAPGPEDSFYLFDQFMQMMEE